MAACANMFQPEMNKPIIASDLPAVSLDRSIYHDLIIRDMVDYSHIPLVFGHQ